MGRYTKEDMARDIVNLLRGNFSDFLKNAAMEKILWAATERRDSDFEELEEVPSAKYSGCAYWSRLALLKAYNITSIEELTPNTRYKNNNGLCHEHVIPKSLMKKYFQDLAKDKELNDDELRYKILNVLNLAVACVVINKEAGEKLNKELKDKMPKGKEDITKRENTWARYENFGDTIYKVKWTIVKSGRGHAFKFVEKIKFDI